jgi:hypothetical protein
VVVAGRESRDGGLPVEFEVFLRRGPVCEAKVSSAPEPHIFFLPHHAEELEVRGCN